MTLHERLLEVRNRLLDSGAYGPDWSAVADGTAVMEAIEHIQRLEAVLRNHDGLLEQARFGDDHPWRLSIARVLGSQSETKGVT
jgi:hypothetical protein